MGGEQPGAVGGPTAPAAPAAPATGRARRWLLVAVAVLVVALVGVLASYERVVEVRPVFSRDCPIPSHLELREHLWGGGQWYRVGPDGAARAVDVGPEGQPFEAVEPCPAGLNA